MKLSIIIVNYNTWDYLKETLTAIYKNKPDFPFEVIVVDNASKDGIKKFLPKMFPQVKLIRNIKNVGFARANNQAIFRSKGEYILFLNPDATPQGNAIEEMVKFMDANPYAGCVGGKLLYPDGKLQLSCRKFPTYISIFFGRRSLLRKLFPGNPFSKSFLLTDLDYNKIQRVDWIIGACIMTRRVILDQLGYFDENFFLFVEDLDFCYRVKKAGFDIVYLPAAVFTHHHGVTINKNWLKTTISHNIGVYKFFSKYSFGPLLKIIGGVGVALRIFYIVLIEGIKKILSLI